VSAADLLLRLMRTDPDRIWPTDDLIMELWPREEPEHSLSMLRRYVWEIRERGITVHTHRSRGYSLQTALHRAGDETDLAMQPKTQEVLEALQDGRGAVVQLDRLLGRVFPGMPRDSALKSLHVHVCRLRKRYSGIENLHGIGYRMVADVD